MGVRNDTKSEELYNKLLKYCVTSNLQIITIKKKGNCHQNVESCIPNNSFNFYQKNKFSKY